MVNIKTTCQLLQLLYKSHCIFSDDRRMVYIIELTDLRDHFWLLRLMLPLLLVVENLTEKHRKKLLRDGYQIILLEGTSNIHKFQKVDVAVHSLG